MDYQMYCRINEESFVLAQRLFKLNKFIESETFKELTEIEKNLLIDQCNCMYTYLKTLHNRIRYYASQKERWCNNG